MRICFFFLLVILHQPASAQKIRFCDTNNRWQTCGRYGMDPTVSFVNDIHLKGDTTISGNNYRIVMIGGGYWGYFVREDTVAGKVYYRWPHTDTMEHVLYDYNLQQGDTMTYVAALSIPPTLPRMDTVEAIDSVLIWGVYHRVIKMNSVEAWGRSYGVIEGIGATNNPLWPTYFSGCLEYYEQLRMYNHIYRGVPTMTGPFRMCATSAEWGGFVNGAYCPPLAANNLATEETLVIYPNPAADVLMVTVPAGTSGVAIMNIHGQTLVNKVVRGGNISLEIAALPHGVYLLYLLQQDGSRMVRRFVKE